MTPNKLIDINDLKNTLIDVEAVLNSYKLVSKNVQIIETPTRHQISEDVVDSNNEIVMVIKLCSILFIGRSKVARPDNTFTVSLPLQGQMVYPRSLESVVRTVKEELSTDK